MIRGVSGLALAAIVLTGSVMHLPAQTSDGFVPLFNGRNLDGWIVENSDGSNFTVADGLLRVQGPQGWLRSVDQYDEFELRIEYRFLTDDADSGVFVRAPGPASNIFMRGWPANAYQVQVRNMAVNTSTQPLWMGHLYRHRVPPGETAYDAESAASAFGGTGDWQQMAITVAGETIGVQLNGVATTTASGVINPRGYIGIQGETGIVEYRRIAVRAATAAPTGTPTR